ncbi:MAG: hypothetical protein ABJ004_09785 [Cyclobacteriaceae bacterium]
MRRCIYILAVLVLLQSCQEESYDPSESFLRIYDNSSSLLSYDPIDIVETSSGYLVLSATKLDDSDFSGVQIIALDETGNFVNEHNLADNYVSPVGDFIDLDTAYSFFAMDESTLSTVMFSVSADLLSIQDRVVISGPAYPLSASAKSNDEILLLTYDPDGLQTVVSRVSQQGVMQQGVSYSIGAGSDVEEDVINHFTDPDRYKLPFFCGEIPSGQVYFNGFYNYSLSLVFSSFADAPDGVLQGQGSNGGVSMALPVETNTFALMGFQFNDNFIRPHVLINTDEISSSIDLMESTISEFNGRSPADILLWEHNDIQYVVVCGETQNRQVALYFYDYVTSELVGIEKIGYQNAFTPSSIKLDDENGLLILGSTYVSGRFKRIFLKKMTEKQVANIL